MNKIEKIADAILYEGYNLFPFRKSALKNRKRFNFGIVSPQSWAENRENETYFQQTEALIFSEKEDFEISVKVRFLQIENQNDDWQKVLPRTVERKFNSAEVLKEKSAFDFEFSTEENFREISGEIEIFAEKPEENPFKLNLNLSNKTDLENHFEENILPSSFVSTHSILQIENGRFISLLETKKELEKYAKSLENIGVFPVLVGDKEKQNAMLSSPIILYDFPEVSESSFDNFFDGTEIDELMVLSILALSDAEKEEIKKTDEKAAKILEKLEKADAQDLLKLHASMTQK